MIPEFNKILMFGLPGSGKTSYLAALTHSVKTLSEEKFLSEYKLSSNIAYADTILKTWLSVQKQERTKIVAATSSNTLAELYLEDTCTKEKFTLHVSDFFGETFENQFIDRLAENKYVEQMLNADGLILFIHPERIREPKLIEDITLANKIAQLIDTKPNVEQFTDEDQFMQNEKEQDLSADNKQDLSKAIQPFERGEIPTQVVLVDLLEVHLEYKKQSPVNLGIIISAWDIVKKQMPQFAPEEWLKKCMPLLWQYLISNFESINFKAFGVSALGGNIENEDEYERLIALNEPAGRVIVEFDETNSNDITLPIVWIKKQWENKTK